MRLFAFNINARRCGYGRVTREAYLINRNYARAGVLYFFYLVRSWLVKPFIYHPVVESNVPYAFLTRIIFLFAGSSGKNYKGDGNGKFFHNTQNINKVLNSKTGQLNLYINNC